MQQVLPAQGPGVLGLWGQTWSPRQVWRPTCQVAGADSVLVGMLSARRTVADRPADAGFTLVEVLVASSLLGLAVAAVMTLLVRSGLNNLEAGRAEALAAVARSSLDDLGNVDHVNHVEQVWCPSIPAWQDDCGAEAPRFRRTVHAVPVAAPGLAGESVEVREVTVVVTALQMGRAAGERTIRLVTFRMAGER